MRLFGLFGRTGSHSGAAPKQGRAPGPRRAGRLALQGLA
jgi:hypothetical protein